MLAMPIIVIFFKENGLSLTQIMILQSVYSLTVALTEIPSGYFADFFGRKKSIIISTILSFCGYLIFSNYCSFEAFIIAEILVALGGSLMSGADSALMYDSLKKLKKEERYTQIEGKSYAIGNFSESIAGLIGGLIASVSIVLPVQIQTIVLFFSIPVAFSLVDIRYESENKNILYNIKNALSFSLRENSKLKWLIIFSSIMGVGTLSAAWLAQPFFQSIEIPIIYFGLLWATLNMTSGVSSYNSHKIETKSYGNKLLLTVSLIMSFSFVIIFWINNYVGLFFLYLIYYNRGIITPILKNQINKITNSEIRATVLSIRSFILRISFAIVAPILGFIGDKMSISYSFLIIGTLVFIVSCLSVYKLKTNSSS